MAERKSEEFETDTKEWKVYFDIGDEFGKNSCVEVRFAKSKHSSDIKEIEELKQDLKDLGKLRIIKQGKNFLER